MSDLTDAEKQAIEIEEQRKAQPLTAEQNAALEPYVQRSMNLSSNYMERILNMRRTPTPYEINTSNRINLFADARLAINAPSENETEEERKKREELEKRKSNALMMFNAFQAIAFNGDKQKFDDWVVEGEKDYGVPFHNLTPAQKEIIKSQQIMDKFEKYTDEYGVLPRNILASDNFSKFVTPDTYRYYASAHNLAHANGIFKHFNQSFSQGMAERAEYFRFLQDGDIQEHNRRMQVISGFYTNPEDSEWLTSAYKMMSNIYAPIVDNPKESLLGLVVAGGASLAGSPALGLAVFTAMTIGRDSASLAQASMAEQVMNENPDVDFQKLLGRLSPFAYVVGGLDIGGFGALASFAWKDVIKQSAMGLIKKFGIEKLATETGKKELVQKAEKTFSNVMKDTAKNIAKGTAEFAGTTAAETATEVGQDVIEQYAVNKELGIEGKDNIKSILAQAKQTATETPIPIAILTAIMGFPRMTAFTVRSISDFHQVYDSATQRVADEVIAESPIKDKNETAATDVADEVLTSRIYGNKADIIQKLKAANIPEEEWGTVLKNRLDKAENGDPVVLTRGEYGSKVAENIRDVINDCFTDKDGNATPSEMNEFYSEKELSNMRAKLNEQIPKVQKVRDEQIKIEKDVYEQLIGKVKGVAPEQINEMAHLNSLFLTSLSRSTDMSVTDLFDKYKPKYELYNVENMTEKKSAIDDPNVLAVYDPKTNKITYKKNVDFNSVFHETAHWYLQTLRVLAKENQNVKEQLDALGKWANVKDIENLSDKDFNELSEKFVAGFITSLITGKGYAKELQPFKRFLSSIRNFSLFKNFDKLSGMTKEEYLTEGFRETYNDNLPSINQDFKNFISSMFSADVISELQEMSYASTSRILDQIDTWTISENEKVAVKDELKKALSETNNVIDGQIQTFTMKRAMAEMAKGGHDFAEFLRDVLKNSPDAIKNKKAYISYLNKLIKAAEDFEVIARAERIELSETPLYQYLDGRLKDIKITTNGLSERQVVALKNKGYIGSETEGVALSDLVNDEQLPQEIKDVINNAKTSKSTALYEFLVRTPTIEERAAQIAQEQIKPYFEKDIVEAYAKLQIDIAKVHKSIAKSTLYGIGKSIGTDRATINANAKLIEQIAQRDINDLVYSKAKATIFQRNAARENANAMKAFSRGEVNGIAEGVKHLRNEYYQNSKAQYVTELKESIANRLEDAKKVARWSDKKVKQNGYDTDLVDLLRHVLYQIGYSTRQPVQTLEEIQESVIERHPETESLINNMMQTLKDSHTLETYWENQTFRQLQDTLDMTDSIIETAKNTNSTLVDGKRVEYETIANELMNAKGFKKEKSKLRDLQTGEGKRSVTRKNTRLDRLKEAGRVYNGSTVMMEQLCQIMDLEQLGNWHKNVYQPLKDGETTFKSKADEKFTVLQEVLNKIKRIETKPIEAPELVLHDGSHWEIGAANGRFGGKTTLELLGMMLHMGANFEKFLDGYLADAEHIDVNDKVAQLQYKKERFEAFFQRMIKEGHITKEMMDFCQTVWNLNEELYADVQRANKIINGYAFKKLETRTIKVNFDGKDYIYQAGYVPAMLNKDKNPDVRKEASITENASHLKDTVPYKEPSFVKSRTNVSYELELDPVKLAGQIKATARFAYLMPAVVQVERAFKNQELRDQLEAKYPGLYENVISKWLNDVATVSSSKINNRLEAIANAYIRGASMQLMCLNMINVLQQAANIPTLLVKCNLKELFVAIAKCIAHPIDVSNKMFEESEFMRVRIQEKTNGINEIFNDLTLNASLYENSLQKGIATAKNINDFLYKNTYIGQKVFQNILDRVGYVAGRMAAERLGYKGRDAVRYAEMTVRECFTSFDITDVAGVQRGSPVTKAFTMFTGYFISMFRLNQVQFKIACDRYGLTNPMRYLALAHAFACCYVYNALIAEMFNSVAHGIWGDDDGDEDMFAVHLALSPLRQRTNAFPVLNKAFDVGWDKLEGKSYYSSAFLSTPVLTETTSGIQAFKKMLDTEENITGKDIRAAMMLSGIVLNIPIAGFVSRPISHIYDIEQGNVKDEDVFEFVNAILTGTTAPKNRLN